MQDKTSESKGKKDPHLKFSGYDVRLTRKSEKPPLPQDKDSSSDIDSQSDSRLDAEADLSIATLTENSTSKKNRR